MDFYNLVRNYYSELIPEEFDILKYIDGSSITLAKVRHNSGRICYTWCKVPINIVPTKLRSIPPEAPSAILAGTYSVIVPSCSGVVEETHNTLNILKMKSDIREKPTRISLHDGSHSSPFKHPTVYPLVEPDRLSDKSWLIRSDEILNSAVNDSLVTLDRIYNAISEANDTCGDFINAMRERIYIAKQGLANTDSPELIKECFESLGLCTNVVRNVETLIIGLPSAVETMKIRSDIK